MTFSLEKYAVQVSKDADRADFLKKAIAWLEISHREADLAPPIINVSGYDIDGVSCTEALELLRQEIKDHYRDIVHKILEIRGSELAVLLDKYDPASRGKV